MGQKLKIKDVKPGQMFRISDMQGEWSITDHTNKIMGIISVRCENENEDGAWVPEYEEVELINTTVQVFGQVEAEKSNLQKAFDLIRKFVPDADSRMSFILEIGDIMLDEYKRGFNDCKEIHSDNEPLGYGVSCIAHREDNATIVDPIKAA